MLIKCPNCGTKFNEKLNICPACGWGRHVLSLAKKNETEKAELLRAEVKRLENKKQDEERAARSEEEYKMSAPEREAREKAAEEELEIEREAAEEQKIERVGPKRVDWEKAEIERAKDEKVKFEMAVGEETELERVELENSEFERAETGRIVLEEESSKKSELKKFVTSIEVAKQPTLKEKGNIPRKKIGKKLLVTGLLFFLVAGMGTFLTWKIVIKATQINIVISSVPDGAEVYLDEVATGLKTPAILKNVKEGEHILTLKLGGYTNLLTTLSVVARNRMQQPAAFKLSRKVLLPIKMEVAPLVTGGRTMLPIRPIIEALGGVIQWVIPNKEVQIKANGVTINLWINKNYDNGDGIRKLLDPTNPRLVPILISGRTLLPIKFINKQLGITVTWDEATKEATIKFKN
jgi:hypothetical protein